MVCVCVYGVDRDGFASVWVRAIVCDDQSPTVVVEYHLFIWLKMNDQKAADAE